jgi:AcrR family transcriptional regulator
VAIDEIGTAAGISGPGLYRHFTGKDALLATLLVDSSERLLAGGRARARTKAADPLLRSLVSWQVEFALANPELIVIHERDLAALPPDRRRRVRQLQRSYVEIWVTALRETAPDLPEPVARTAVHAAIGLINSTPHSVPAGGREQMTGVLQQMALAALHAVRDPA